MSRMKLYVLDNGTMELDKAYLVAIPNPGTIDNKHPPAIWEQIPIYTVLIDHPDGYILFDTACHPKGMTERWPEGTRKAFPYFADEACYLPNRLEQLKVRPEDIRYVVASHLHLDHAGCLEMFTNAEIIVHDDELMRTMKQYAINKDMGAYIWADIEAWVRKGLHWRTIKPHEKEVPLVDGVSILNFGSGHAWGMLGLFVQLAEHGNLILASDAIYTSENIGPPIRIPGIIYDSVGYTATVERILQMANERNARVWYGHDRRQFSELIKSTEGYYE